MATNAAPVDESTRVRLFVESDLILRAPDLRFRTGLDIAAARQLLELAGAEDSLVQALTDVREVSEAIEVRGRNIASAGPRPPVLAIRRGSEAELAFGDPDSAAQCRSLLIASGSLGIGERRLEGHGRLRVDFAPRWEPMGKHGASGVGVNVHEQLLAEAQEWLKNGFPGGFGAKRWQDLRNAARAPASALFKAWLTQARREVERLKDKSANDSEKGEGGSRWLQRFEEKFFKAGQLADTDRPLLRTIGLLAAKRKSAGTRRAGAKPTSQVEAASAGDTQPPIQGAPA